MLLELYLISEMGDLDNGATSPNSKTILNKAILRLKFEEIFYLQLRFIFKKNIRKEKIKGYSFPIIGKKFDSFFDVSFFDRI